MIRYLPFLIEIALLVYCLIDCIQTDVPRNLSKTTWVFVIILLPIVGGIAWLVAGRPERRATPGRAVAVDAGPPGSPSTSGRAGRPRTTTRSSWRACGRRTTRTRRCSRTGRRSCATGSSKLKADEPRDQP